MAKKTTVLITGARSIVALHMARSFASAGYEVHMADCSSAFFARMSKAPRCVHRYASPRRDPTRFNSDIQRIIRTVDPVIVIPTCEEVFYLACPQLQAMLDGKLFAPPRETLKTLHEKDTFISACAGLGLPVPQTHLLQDTEHLRALCPDPSQWVFKQRYSRFGAKTMVSPQPDALSALSFDPENPWLAQRRIHGRELSFYAIAREGRLAAFAPYSSSWRLAGGASYAFSPIDATLSDKLEIFAGRLAAGLNINGQFSCDIIADKDNEIWPLECNPRATSGLHLLSGDVHVSACLYERTRHCHKANVHTHFQSATFATYGLATALANLRMAEWLNILTQGRDVMSSKNDRWPIAGAFIDALIFKHQAIKKNISLAQATTSDIEWNGEHLT